MTDDERMIQAIREYWFDLGDPMSSWPKDEFERVAYSKWAVDEILTLFFDNVDWTPLRATEEFKYIMGTYMCRSTNFTEINHIFEIAYRAASDISDILMGMF